MYSRLKQSKRALSFVLALVLVLNIVLSSGFFRVAVQAADEDAPDKVIYVDGVGSDEADGTTAEKAYKTIAQAYLDIPAGNTKTVIVICGNVSMRAEGAGMTTITGVNGTSTYTSTSFYAARDIFHEGEVVFTSTWGGINYKTTKSAQLQTAQNYMLMGNTTFENIYITGRPYALYANYYNLCIGEGVTTSSSNEFASILYLGTNSTNYNAIRYSDVVESDGIPAKDVTFTMKSCTVANLYGHGSSYQGDGNNGKSFKATLNIEGGTVTNLIVKNANETTKINDLNVTIGNASVNAWTLGTNTFITGTKTITYKNKTGAVSVAGFDALELENSSVTVSSLDTVETIKTTDTSSLTVETAPEGAIPVTVTKAGHKWVSNGALITAPADTAEDTFVLTESGDCVWKYANGTNATWTVEGEPDVFYVGGANGNDNNDGLSANNALETLAAAYAKISATNKVTYIVICGDVKLVDSLVTVQTKNVIGQSGGIKHTGTVVLTSEYKGNSYRGEGVGLDLGGLSVNWDLLGDTVIENIDIRKDANNITANYFKLHFGKGIGVHETGNKRVAYSVTLGFGSMNLYNNGVLKHRPRDIVFTMESGAITVLNGTGQGNQGWDNKDGNGKYNPYNVTLNIEGGKIETLNCADNNAEAAVNNINVHVGGNAVVDNLAAKNNQSSNKPTIKGEIACVLDLNGRYMELNVADEIIKLYLIDTANKKASGEGAGTLKMTGIDLVQKIAQDPVSKMRFAAIKSEGNVYTANPFNLTIAQVGLNTKAGANDDEVAICLRAMYLANDLAKPTDFGISYLDENGKWQNISAAGSAYSFDGKNLVNAFYNLNGALEKLDNTNSYRVYMVVNGETVYSDYVANITPRTVLTNINNQLKNGGSITEAQYASLKNLVDNNSEIASILTHFN